MESVGTFCCESCDHNWGFGHVQKWPITFKTMGKGNQDTNANLWFASYHAQIKLCSRGLFLIYFFPQKKLTLPVYLELFIIPSNMTKRRQFKMKKNRPKAWHLPPPCFSVVLLQKCCVTLLKSWAKSSTLVLLKHKKLPIQKGVWVASGWIVLLHHSSCLSLKHTPWFSVCLIVAFFACSTNSRVVMRFFVRKMAVLQHGSNEMPHLWWVLFRRICQKADQSNITWHWSSHKY